MRRSLRGCLTRTRVNLARARVKRKGRANPAPCRFPAVRPDHRTVRSRMRADPCGRTRAAGPVRPNPHRRAHPRTFQSEAHSATCGSPKGARIAARATSPTPHPHRRTHPRTFQPAAHPATCADRRKVRESPAEPPTAHTLGRKRYPITLRRNIIHKLHTVSSRNLLHTRAFGRIQPEPALTEGPLLHLPECTKHVENLTLSSFVETAIVVRVTVQFPIANPGGVWLYSLRAGGRHYNISPTSRRRR